MLEVRTELLNLLPRLRRFCIALLGNREAADELLVERMQRFVRQRKRPSGDALRIALFQSVVDGYCARAGSTRLIGVTAFPRRHRVGQQTGPEAGAPPHGVARCNGTAFAQALRELDAEDRAALLLKDLEGMTYEDTARVMGKSIDDVRSHHYRAHHALMRMTSGSAEGAAGTA